MKTAVQCLLSFGDCMFNTALTRAVAAHNPDGKVPVLTQAKYRDAYQNLPWVSSIITDGIVPDGYSVLDSTPSTHFWGYKNEGHEFSLIDTHLVRGRTIGIADFDQRPAFNPTGDEVRTAMQFMQEMQGPVLAIESAYFSGQSWSNRDTINTIVSHYLPTHNILWLSNQDAPQHPRVDNGLRFTRRQLITILRHCDLFITTGSGFFCASLASPGPRTICLWRDETYKYERRLAQLGWRCIEWVHNRAELEMSFAGPRVRRIV